MFLFLWCRSALARRALHFADAASVSYKNTERIIYKEKEKEKERLYIQKTKPKTKENGCFAMQSGLFHRLGEYSNVGRESEKAKQLSFGICSIRSIWLQVPSFPRARPRMYRREVWVAAINLIEAHSHTLCSF